jgi:LPPG:FO 2-phospho-L-lactate transferase
MNPDRNGFMNIVGLAGGVGGAKLADGLQRVLGKELTVIVNTGDDFELHGLRISPDVDTMMYTLAGLANPETGWGIEGDTFTCLAMLALYGADDWFGLGDRDLAAHILRSCWRRDGMTLQEVTARLSRALGVAASIVPMTNDPVSTIVGTNEGDLAFQEYFVHRGWAPIVKSLSFAGIDAARPSDEALRAIERAQALIICPSNPFVSIEPILSVGDLRTRVANAKCPRIAVSPIVSGEALRGPAAKMSRELGVEPSAFSVAKRYQALIDGFVLDRADGQQTAKIQELGMEVLVADTVMRTNDDRERLAREILSWIAVMPGR